MNGQTAVAPVSHRHGHTGSAASKPSRLVRGLRTAATARNRQRLAMRLAAQLARAHGIRARETALAPWLTRMHCANNGAALARWVLHELLTVDQPLTSNESELLETLSCRLARLLADLTEAQPC